MPTEYRQKIIENVFAGRLGLEPHERTRKVEDLGV